MKEVVDAWARTTQVAGILTLIVVLIVATMGAAVDALGFVRVGYILANILIFAYVLLHSRRGGVSLMVAFYFLFFIAVPASVQIVNDSFPFVSRYNEHQLMGAYQVLAVAQIAYLLGEALMDARRRARPRAEQVPDQSVRARTYRRAVVWLALLSWTAALVVGPSTLFLNREERAFLLISSEGIDQQVLFVGRSLSLVGALLAIFVLLRSSESRRSPAFLGVAVLALGSFAILHYPPSLSRFQLLGSILAILAILTSFFLRSRKLAFGVLAPIFLFYFFPAIKVLGQGGAVDVQAALDRDVTAYLLRVDFDGFKQIIDTVQYAASHPPRWGENFLGVLFFWVPRTIWPSKPVDSGFLVSSGLGYRYTNVSNPLPAEGYISFGILGTFAVMAILGLAVSALEVRAREAELTGLLRNEVVLNAMSMGFIVIVLRGAINGVAPMFLAGFIAFALVVLADHRAQSRHRQGVEDNDGNRLRHYRSAEGGNLVPASRSSRE